MVDRRSNTNPMLKLEKVLGITTSSNASISAAPRSSDTYYAAGSVVVRYNAAQNSQKSFYKASKAVSCLCVSPDGVYLAVGERGHSPSIIIWEISTNKVISTIVGTHKHGIGCLVFSPDSRYLISAGFKHDRQLIIWEWENLRKVSVQKLGNKVNALCFHPSGSYFVTCGDRHLKWWYLNYEIGSLEVTGKPASILENHKNAVFMDMKIGSGDIVYCVTSTGLLCAFNDTRFMDMWVQLESSVSYALSMASSGSQDIVIVGCTEGLIRVFSAKSLQYLATLPLPVPTVGYTEKYPACLAVCTVDGPAIKGSSNSKYPKIAAAYSDHSLFVWDIADIHNCIQYRSFAYHRSCIWDVQFITSVNSSDAIFPVGTFATCSADNTIRIWSGEKTQQRSASGRPNSGSRQTYGEMLHLIEVSPNAEHNPPVEKAPVGAVRQSNMSSATGSSSVATTITDVIVDPNSAQLDLGTGIPDLELPYRPQIAMAPRSMAIHPMGRQLVCGDRSGLLRVYDLGSMREIYSTQAHSAEVLTLHYSPPVRPTRDGSWTSDLSDPNGEEEELVLLASAGRDRLVHVFDASAGYCPIRTLDNHSSSVTVVKFTPDGTRLLSCGGDRTMVFNSVVGTEITRVKSVQTPHGTINDLAIEVTNKFAVTSGQDRRLNIWNMQSGKHVRAYKNDAVTGELYKSDIDPSGMYVAACAFDKTVNLFDFFSGDLVAQVSGHSELITSVRFSPDGRFLLSVGGDGCVMMWGMAEPLVAAMQERLLELVSSAQTRQLQVVIPTGDGGHSSRTSPKGSPVSVRPPPPPSYQAAMAVSAAAIVSGEKVEVRKVADSVGASVASGRGSRWASRVDPQGGYELFGRKMGNSSAQKMKLTLEPSSFKDIGGISHDSVEAEKGHVVKGDYQPEELSECDMNDDSLEGPESAYIGNKLANTLEAGDDVMGFKDPDECNTSTHAKKSPRDKHRVSPRVSPRSSPRKDGGHGENFDRDGDESGSEAYLAKATSKIDTLEQSASHLESWLESMIRNGNGTSSGAVGVKDSKAKEHDAVVAAVDQSSLLSNSLSSLFFKNLQVSKGDRADERLRSEVMDNMDDDLPPPPRHTTKERSKEKEVEKGREKDSVSEMPVHRGVDDLDASVLTMDSMTAPSLPPSSSSSISDTMDSRRKETAAAVAQMKSKLRNMGMLGATGEVARKIDRSKQTSRHEDSAVQSTSGSADPVPTKAVPVPVPVPVTTVMADAQPKLSFAAVDESNLPPSPPLISELGNVTNRSRSRSRSVSPKRQGVPIPVFKDSDEDDDDEADDEDYGSIQGTIAFGAAIDCNGSRSSKGSTPVKDVMETLCIEAESDRESVDVKVERTSSSPPLPQSRGSEEDDLRIASPLPSPVGVAVTGFPPSSTTSSAASSPKKKSSGADAALKIDDEENKQEKALREKIQEQEDKLRAKAAQCKQIISELTRAKEAALSSFDELADLRSSLLDMTAASTHTQSRVLVRDSVPILAAHDGGMNDTCDSDFTAFYPQSVPREEMENTTDILQGSVVAAEADALLSEFRQSFLAPELPTGTYSVSQLSRSHREGTFSIGRRTDRDSGGGRGSDRLKLNVPLSESSPTDTDRIQEGDGGSSSRNVNVNGTSYTSNKAVSPKKDSIEDVEMLHFLEKYSDRLVDMVSDKVMAKSILKERSIQSP